MVSLQAAFAALVLSSPGQTVLLDFYADWCGPCRAMNPTVEALVEQGYPVRRVNIDQNRPLAAKYGIRNIPCFVMVVDGQEVDRVVGGTSFSRLERMCKIEASAARSDPPPLLAHDPAPPTIQPLPQPLAPPANDRFASSAWRGEQPSSRPLKKGATAGLPSSAGRNTRGNTAGQASSGTRTLGGQLFQPVSNGPARRQRRQQNESSDAALIAASVRLRIEDADGHSCGSGTIVDARDGEALVLTCGHIFRDSKGKGRIDVDLFGPGGPRQVQGRLISYDLTRDVGLVAIRPQGPVTTARLAPPDYRVQSGLPVVSVGCNNGQGPTSQHSRVTSLDKFLGPPNIQVAGQPVEGRSGGGLFSSEGYLIGVCNAADPSDGEGLFAAPATIRAELNQSQLAFIYRSPSVVPVGASAAEASLNPVAIAAVAPPPMPGSMPGANGMASPASEPSGLTPREQAALDEIRRRLKEGAEVVCIIRPRNKPGAKSEVIMLDRASPEFLERLAAERRLQEGLCPTSLETTRPRKKLLEWSVSDGMTVSNPPYVPLSTSASSHAR
ncbi:MAG: trypsin-like peptidase domain-containing protein [Pirellulales bacterium]|nr:trypsin-like peptidase domain-containing protein [Pirellulales bacterium]